MRLLYLLILFVLLGCSSFSKTNILNKNFTKPRRIVVLIHGIGGSYRHFGHLRESLELHMSYLDSTFCNEIIYFDYKTGDNKLTTFDFSHHLARFLNGYFLQTAPLKKGDKISFVMHSQGGIVGNLWLLQTIKKKKGFPQKYLRHLDAMITLGTPFWGANIAHIATQFYGHNYLPYGKKELEEMTFDSNTISYMRREFIDSLAKIKEYPIRFLNIGGRSWKRSENDTLVDLPSGNQNFIYSKVSKNKIRSKDFKKLKLGHYCKVDAIHLNLMALIFDVESFASISQTYKSCTRDINCNHPTFKKILDFIRGKNVGRDFSAIGGGKFFLDIELVGTRNISRNQVSFLFDLPMPKLVEMDTKHPSDDYHLVPNNRLRFHYSGEIVDSDYNFKELQFSIEIAKKKSFDVQALLIPGVTTYILLDLAE